MKNTINKKASSDQGIAIMFTLIMLSIFFLIAFGFVSMATTARSASKAREPGQNNTLSASETILNEALACMEERLHNSGSEVPDTSYFKNLNFRNSVVDVDLQVWGSSSADRTSLEDALLIQLEPSSADGEFKIDPTDTNWSDFGWIEESGESRAWLVIESNGLDPNYLGSSSEGGLVSGVRNGIYTRELDMTLIDPTNASTLYQDWSAFPWESKKQLVGALASNYDTAVSIYQTNMSPVELTDFTSKFDLKTLQSDTSSTPEIVLDNIEWLDNGTDSTLKNQIAANIKDYIDADTECTYDPTNDVYGVERTPQINELGIYVLNRTEEPLDDGMGNITASPTRIEIKCQGEFINMVGANNSNDWGSTSGANATLEVAINVRATRGGDVVVNTSETVEITSFNLGFTAIDPTYTYRASPDLNLGNSVVTFITGLDSEEAAEISITVEVTKITLKGDGTIIWDVATPNITSDSDDIDSLVESYFAIEANDPRVNHTGWAKYGWNQGPTPTNILNTDESINNNCTTASWNGDYETGGNIDPSNLSTAYMPRGGGITHISELGLISRGETGKTLNLTDYNIKDPTKIGNYKPAAAGGINLSGAKGSTPASSTFDGGDRAILDYVRVTSGDQYKQYSPINPNATNSDVLEFLFKGITTAKGETPTASEVTKVVNRFPGVAGLTSNNIFRVEDFHNLGSDGYHNRNPKSYGHPFSRYSYAFITDGETDNLPDAHREALITKSMRLVTPKYSYYTILTASKSVPASDTSVTPTSYYTFVRRENESGTYKIIFQVSP